MKRQFFPPPIYLQTANGFLWLTLVLYFAALLVMALQPPDFNFLPLYLLISSPFPLIGIWFYILSRERILLTDDSIVWQRIGRPISLRYEDISGYIETGYNPVPALILFDNQDRRIKISRQIQDYHVLYNLLQDRIPVLRQGSPLGFPWILRLQLRYLVITGLGLASLGVLIGSMLEAVGVANHAQNPLRLLAIAGVPVAVLTLVAVIVIGQEFHWTRRLECLSDRIRWVRFWGKVHTFYTEELEDIRREAHQIASHGLARTEWPLVIIFSKGERLVIAEPMASALGISVDRFAAGLKRLYLVNPVQQQKPARTYQGRKYLDSPEKQAEPAKREKSDQARANALIAQGNAYHKSHQYDQAIHSFRQAIQLNPTPSYQTYYLQIGDMLFEMQRFEEAESAYRKLLDIVPEHPHGWLGLGMTLLVTGKFYKAAYIFDRALLLDPRFSEALYYGAIAQASLGNQAKSWRYLTRAIKIQPSWEKFARQQPVLLAYFHRLN